MSVVQDFSLEIEQKALDENKDLIETVIEIATDKGLSFKDLVGLLNPIIKEKIKVEAIAKGYKIGV